MARDTTTMNESEEDDAVELAYEEMIGQARATMARALVAPVSRDERVDVALELVASSGVAAKVDDEALVRIVDALADAAA